MKKDKRKIEEKNSNNMIQNEAIEFQATAKKVQKMSRDGLIEQNKQTGEKTRISKKEQDTSFQKKDHSIPLQRKHDAAVPHSARSKRTRIRNALKSNRKESRDQYSNTSQVSGIDVSKNSLETEEIPVNTHKTRKKYPAGKSKLDYKNHSPTIEQTQKKQQKKVMRSLVLKNKAIKTANRINPPANTPEQRLEKENIPQNNSIQKSNLPFSNDNREYTPSTSAIKQQRIPFRTNRKHKKQFSILKERKGKRKSVESEAKQKKLKKRKLILHNGNTLQNLKNISIFNEKEPEKGQQNLQQFQQKVRTKKETAKPTIKSRRGENLVGQLLYKLSEAVPADIKKEQPIITKEEKKPLNKFQKAENKRNTKKKLYNTSYKQANADKEKLLVPKNQKSKNPQKTDNKNKMQETPQANQNSEKTPLPKNKKLDKLQKKVNKTEHKLKRQRAVMPSYSRLKFEKAFDSNAGKIKGRLKLEKEIKPQGKQNILSTVSKKVTSTAAKEVVSSIHNKIRTTEKDNVGIEAAHKAEQQAENSITSMVYRSFRKVQKRPYEKLSRLEKQMQKVNAKYAYQKVLQDNPLLKNKLFAKFQQKRKIKQKYAKSLRQAQKASSTMKEAFSSGGKAVKAASQFIMRHSFLFAALGVITVLFFLISTGLTSCSSMTTSGLSAIVNTSYLASDKDINEAERYYCKLEEELQFKIDNVERENPGFDIYRYKIGNIGHNPFELMSYLTAEFNDFQTNDIKYTLESIFKSQYDFYLVESVEVKTDSEGNSYTVYILTTYVDVTPLADIFDKRLRTEEKKERYQAYLQTKGNRQYFSSPFVFDWIPYVTEINGNNTMKMTVPADTEILAGKDGTVTNAGYTTIIEDKKGYKAIYSGLSSCSVSYGEKVKAGEIIGTAERNIELLYSYGNQTLNPYFFVAALGSGIPGSPDKPFIPPDPGTPMGDGSYDALIKEAEKYLGYPYVWGGSSPSKSFDCSGFVCWVFTHSGVYDLPRTTAQGIFNQSTPVSPEDAQPGDIITFTNTYSTPNPVSHIGIYVGNGMMIHCGDPISYANINSPYWRSHFYSFGRLN